VENLVHQAMAFSCPTSERNPDVGRYSRTELIFFAKTTHGVVIRKDDVAPQRKKSSVEVVFFPGGRGRYEIPGKRSSGTPGPSTARRANPQREISGFHFETPFPIIMMGFFNFFTRRHSV
jgi:hypothetical protein